MTKQEKCHEITLFLASIRELTQACVSLIGTAEDGFVPAALEPIYEVALPIAREADAAVGGADVDLGAAAVHRAVQPAAPLGLVLLSSSRLMSRSLTRTPPFTARAVMVALLSDGI